MIIDTRLTCATALCSSRCQRQRHGWVKTADPVVATWPNVAFYVEDIVELSPVCDRQGQRDSNSQGIVAKPPAMAQVP